MISLDKTHDPDRRSWVDSANGHREFPIQNLPFGVFEHENRVGGGVAIGDHILDIARLIDLGQIPAELEGTARAAALPRLNAFMAMGQEASTALRTLFSDLLVEGNANAKTLEAALIPQDTVNMRLPCAVGDFTDFLTSLPHTERLGKLKGLAEPVPPAFKSLPVAYHGRSSTIRLSGTPVVRPTGQWRQDDGEIVYAPVESLDYELELGALIGRGSSLARPVQLEDARHHIFGFCLVNDWSAKGIQWWEQILGPFLGKSFMTSLSPWIVTAQALAPFHTPARPRSEGDGPVFDYLNSPADRQSGGLSVELTASIATTSMREAKAGDFIVSRSTLDCMYWTFAQMLTHHTSNGCSLNPGDLLGSGTLSGDTLESMACLSEKTAGGSKPVVFPNGEARGWLSDGDEIVLRGHAHKDGFVSIGFGECRGTVVPAR